MNDDNAGWVRMSQDEINRAQAARELKVAEKALRNAIQLLEGPNGVTGEPRPDLRARNGLVPLLNDVIDAHDALVDVVVPPRPSEADFDALPRVPRGLLS